MIMDLDIAQFDYVNHKGVKNLRTVRPIQLWFGSTAYHPEPQWLLKAFCLGKQATRDFAMSNVSNWKVAKDHPMYGLKEVKYG